MTRTVKALLILLGTVTSVAQSQGRVTAHSIDSRIYGRARKVWVYTPPGYKNGPASYPLVVAFDAEDYRSDTMRLPKVLDSLAAAGKSPPMVALMIDDGSGPVRLNDLANQPGFAEFLATEAIPWLRRQYNVTRDPRRTIVTGSSAGGLAAAYVALVHPEIFGNVLSQSGAFWRGAAASNSPPFEWLTGQFSAQPRKNVRFFVDVGGGETHRVIGGSGPVFIEAVRHFRDALKSKGYDVVYNEVPGGVHAPQTWRPRLPVGLVALTEGWPR
ncbi:MAG TPA: alpha/beta hydrolase-fold protein [Gemmatimonadaceae bacterium]|nr:alpha/beta hydrolase-fold protein [Gemmatimonadaceae bacterium]